MGWMKESFKSVDEDNVLIYFVVMLLIGRDWGRVGKRWINV